MRPNLRKTEKKTVSHLAQWMPLSLVTLQSLHNKWGIKGCNVAEDVVIWVDCVILQLKRLSYRAETNEQNKPKTIWNKNITTPA